MRSNHPCFYKQIDAYNAAMRRKPGQLLPLELTVCRIACDLGNEFYGYQLAKCLQEVADSRLLTAYGTLYRALGRLEDMGFLKSHWEDPTIPARENRPGRRLYLLTAAGEAAGRQVEGPSTTKQRKRMRRKWAPA
jgi:PadR family transcriptional regulator PadR